MLARCLDMAQLGKISRKNCWDIDVIEHLPAMAGSGDAAARQNLLDSRLGKVGMAVQLASSVYSMRIDALLEQILNICSQAAAADASAGACRVQPCSCGGRCSTRDPGPLADEGAEQNGTQGTQKRKRTAHETVESTLVKPETLEQPSTERAVAADPLFCAVSASFDEGKISRLLTKNLSCFEACNLQITSNVRPAELVATQSDKLADARLDLAWAAPHLQRVCDSLGAAQHLAPSVGSLDALTGADADRLERAAAHAHSIADAQARLAAGAARDS